MKVVAFLLALSGLMPTIYYSQDFSDGNGDQAFQVALYEKFPPTSDPADSVYPFATAASFVEVIPSAGHSGGNALWWWDDPGSGTDDPHVAGYVESGDFTAPAGQGVTRRLRVKVKPQSTVFDDPGGASVFSIIGGMGAAFNNPHVELSLTNLPGFGSSASDFRYYLEYQDWNDGTVDVFTAATTRAAVENQYLTIDAIVKTTSAGQNDLTGPTDGWIKVLVNGTEIYNITGIAPYLNWQSGQPDKLNKVEEWNVGYDGLLGYVSYVEISDYSDGTTEPTAVSPNLPVDDSIGCCAEDVEEGGGIAPPGAGTNMGDDAPLLRPGWTARCTGGGMVPTANDLPNGERWG